MKNLRQYVLLTLVVFMININFIVCIRANSNFTIGLELGTQIYEIKHYDELTWNNTIDSSINPIHWFGGEANKVGARSQLTIENWDNNDFITSVIFKKFLYSNETLSVFPIVSDYGYGNDYINENYTHYYFVWAYSFHLWSFTTDKFNIRPDFYYQHSMIMKNPQNFTQILENYNDYADKINNNATLQSLNISFPILTGDDLLWPLVVRNFAIAQPINEYLKTLKGALDCNNVSIEGNTLIFQREGEQNYSVEATYNSQGLIETFVVKNSEGSIVYKITSSYTKTVFYIILGIIAICVLGIVIVFIIKKISRKA